MLNRVIVTLLLCVMTLVTNRWLSYQDGIDILKAADTQSYMTIAKAAPALPQLPPEKLLPTNHSARLLAPYLVGAAARYMGASVETMFLLCTLACCVVVVWSFHRALTHYEVSDTHYILVMATLICNPYMFRYYLAVPAMVNDIVFVAGLSLTLLALVKGSFSGVLIGALVALFGRQNALVFLPAAAVWIVFGTAWMARPLVQRLMSGAILIGVMVGTYVGISFIIAPFSVRGMESDALTGLAKWFVAGGSGKFIQFVEYCFRSTICLFFPLAMFLGAAFGAERGRTGSAASSAIAFFRSIFRSMPREFWLALLFVAALFGFAFLGGPELFMSGVTRYVSHALPAAALALALALGRFGVLKSVSSPAMLAFGALLFAGSFHHMTTFAGTTSDKAMYFAVIYTILAIFVGIITFIVARGETNENADSEEAI